MKIASPKEPLVLLVGDFCFFLASLWLALFFRNFSIPSRELWSVHLTPFTILFFVWVLVFYIAGLYGKHTLILRSRLPSTLLNSLIANSIIAVFFFYFIPFFGITPKTVMFLHLAISFVLILFWRVYGYLFIGSKKTQNGIIVGSGPEVKELHDEVNRNNIYNIRFVSKTEEASVIIADFSHEKLKPLLPDLYTLIFSGVTFLDLHKVYEDIFDRVPLSVLKYNWFLENISTTPRYTYDTLKRIMDALIAVGLIILTIPFDILAMIMIKLDDGGPIFIHQDRVGKNNKIIRITKFRTMTANDNGNYGEGGTSNLKVTRVGRFLRRSRIDEFPQLWSVIKGDQSLVGPRPELPSLTKLYDREIPYYNVRHIIKPGLSGWAQIYQENHPHHGEAVEQTREKLSYDLYYIKNRSLVLDLQIALKTVKTLLSRVGV